MSYPVMSTSIPWSLVKSGFHKTPHFSTDVQTPAAGRGRSSCSYMPFGTWDFEVDLNYVLGGESMQFSVLQSFLGVYLACRGRGSFFLFTDPNDNTVENVGGDPATDQSLMLNVTPGAVAPMGTVGDGSSHVFQLARAIDQGRDVIQNASAVTVYVNGSPASVSISPAGVVTFAVAPASGARLSWEGSFQYLCQFSDDTLRDLARVSKNANGFLWSCASIAFESVLV